MLILFLIYIIAIMLLIKKGKTKKPINSINLKELEQREKAKKKLEEKIEKLRGQYYINEQVLRQYGENESTSKTRLIARNIILDENIENLENELKAI